MKIHCVRNMSVFIIIISKFLIEQLRKCSAVFIRIIIYFRKAFNFRNCYIIWILPVNLCQTCLNFVPKRKSKWLHLHDASEEKYSDGKYVI